MPRGRLPFLTNSQLVKAITKKCVKEDIAVDHDTVEAIVNLTFDVLFSRLTSDKRIDGDYFKCKLFRATVVDKPERLYRNPKTGGAVAKGSSRVIKFKTSADLDDVMEDKFRAKPSKSLLKLEAEKNGVEFDEGDIKKKKKKKKNKDSKKKKNK